MKIWWFKVTVKKLTCKCLRVKMITGTKYADACFAYVEQTFHFFPTFEDTDVITVEGFFSPEEFQFLVVYCSDFRYESNGIFVLGVGFFSSDKIRLFN